MRTAVVALLGLVFATGLGFAAHVIARDTVALPVASIDARENLAPASSTTGRTTTLARTAIRPRRRGATTRTETTRTTTTATSTDEDGKGRGRGRGRSGGDSGSSGSSGSGSESSGSSGSGSSGSDSDD